jgi:prolyl oligopeptidase
MRCALLSFLVCLSLFSAAFAIDYPATLRGDTIDSYHGTQVPDPYRWLEQIESPEVRTWVEQQNSVSFGYLRQIPNRDKLLARMKEMLSYERWGMPAEEGGRYFFTRNDGLANFSVVCTSGALDFKGRVLLDPNTWSSDGSVSLQDWRISEDGQRILYAKSVSGSDWSELHVLDVDSGQDLPDVIQWAKFGAGYWADASGTGFYYLRFPQPKEGEEFLNPNFNPMIYYHRIGTPQSEDVLQYSLPEHPDWWVSGTLSEDYQLALYYIGERGSINNRYYVQRNQPDAPVIKLLDKSDANYGFVGNEGDRLWFLTDKDAPNGRLVEIDLKHPAPSQWKTLIPESAHPLENVTYTGGVLFAEYLKDARSVIHRYAPDGTYLGGVPLPGFGAVSGFGGRSSDTQTFFNYVDYTTPTQNYRYDIPTNTVEPLLQPKFPADLSRYESKLQFYRSADGTAVPLFVMHKRGVVLDGNSPTMLYAYGGFGGSMVPYFSSSRLAWLDCGGVYAIACIRGGAEYGKAWHEAAIKQNRQVSFNDFIAAAEYLIDAGYTSPARLAINGGSQGGMLVGAVTMQRPDLYAVSLPQVPVADMLRFNQFTSGKSWESDYGSPQNAAEFAALFAYSPYHNVQPGTCYPATLITTADTDDRVVPSHSFKLAAAMQHGQGCDKPVLLRVETSAGHGAGKPLDKVLEEIVDIYGFALHNMGVQIPASL